VVNAIARFTSLMEIAIPTRASYAAVAH
jgi:hypothetical protein